MENGNTANRRRDDAVRAAWLYFNAGRTQDDIARQLNLSRQATQRLIAQAVNERLVSFRIEHPIAACMDLANQLCTRFGLDFADVVPADHDAPDAADGLAQAAAMRVSRLLHSQSPTVLGVGTGRTLRAMVPFLEEYERPQHKILSLVGNMALDGRASPYEVAMRIADKMQAQRYPLSLPVIAETIDEKEMLQRQRSYRLALELQKQAQAHFVGVAEIAWQAPLHQDGFASDQDISELVRAGAVGEMIGWAFNEAGEILQAGSNLRLSSLPLASPPHSQTVLVGGGPKKIAPIKAALAGKLANALITDEVTAQAVLG